MRVLYVDGDADSRTFVQAGLGSQGISVEAVGSAAEGLDRAVAGDHDVLILDVELPDRDGFELLRELRESGVAAPALFLSARSEVSDRVRGLDLGADDYLPKPFAFSELLARLRVIARRRGVEPGPSLRVADLELDLATQRVTRAGRPVDLTPKQFALLEVLARSAGRVVPRQKILERVWGPDVVHRSNAIEVQVNYLRKKIDRDFPNPLIHTRPGLGYILEDRSEAGAEG